MEAFDCLPLGALVNGKFLALHGGISPDMRSTNQINSVPGKLRSDDLL